LSRVRRLFFGDALAAKPRRRSRRRDDRVRRRERVPRRDGRRADDECGQRLRAFVVVEPGASFSEQDVKDDVRTLLARYKVPRDVRFLDELPRNPTGKVLKRHLDSD
jgi:acyl-CoA synthetase (AMP-forming)/AMP-acid ligase II